MGFSGNGESYIANGGLQAAIGSGKIITPLDEWGYHITSDEDGNYLYELDKEGFDASSGILYLGTETDGHDTLTSEELNARPPKVLGLNLALPATSFVAGTSFRFSLL